MEVLLDLNKRYSYADYLNWADNKRREIINGFVHLMAGPSEFHARLTSTLNILMGMMVRSRKGKCRIYHAPFDVRLPLNGSNEEGEIFDVVQPDLCVVCDLSKIDKNGIIGAPDLIVEVLSLSTQKYDWNYKFNLYEKAGVREYWIVDPKAKIVNVFLLQSDGTYDKGAFYECNQKVPVFIFEGLEIDLSELFEV